MYKYDIPFPNKEQYTLLFGHDAKLLWYIKFVTLLSNGI
jgi:hypothetical protein